MNNCKLVKFRLAAAGARELIIMHAWACRGLCDPGRGQRAPGGRERASGAAGKGSYSQGRERASGAAGK
eukprot:SAG22_NODE_2042_length_3090_cov_9.718823_7_plen_68_part_01